MKARTYIVALSCTVALLAVASSQSRSAAEPDDWLVTWYLSRAFGSGHHGQTMFVVPDGSGGIWTNSTSYSVSRLWHISADDVTPHLTLGCPEEWPEERRAKLHLDWELDPHMGLPWTRAPLEEVTTLRGPEGTRWRKIRGLLDAARMPDGRLWIATADGLIEIDGEETTFHARVQPVQAYGPSYFSYSSESPPLSSVPTTALCVDGYGELWAYGQSMGLIRRTNAGGEEYPKYGVWTKYLPYYPGMLGGDPELDAALEDQAVTVIRAPSKGEVVIGTEAGELFIFEQRPRGPGTSVSLRERISPDAIGGAGPVTDIMRDSQGRLWCTHRGEDTHDGYFRGSAAVLDDAEWRVWHCGNSSLPCRAVATICEIRPGQVWIGVNWADPVTAAGGTKAETGLFEFVSRDWVNLSPRSYWAERHKVVGVDPKYWWQDITNESTRELSLIRVDDRGRVWVGSEGGLACFEAVPKG